MKHMGFIKWLYKQYKEYKLKKIFPTISQEEKERAFMNNFRNCVDMGFTPEQLLALINLIDSNN